MLKEIEHLRAGAGPNVIALREVLFKEHHDSLSVVCVFDYAEHDLLGVTARRIRFGSQSVKFIFKEVVRGVAHLHAQGIFHRDLKTANILLDRERGVKVADLGLAEEFKPPMKGHNARLKKVLEECLPRIETGSVRSEQSVEEFPALPAKEEARERSFHCEVTTLLYRAPEQLLRIPGGHSFQADVWGLGCILLELLLGRPFFLAAKNKDHLLGLLLKLFGRSAFEEYAEGLQSPEFATREKVWRYGNFGEYLVEAGLEPLSADLLVKMMRIDPARRIDCPGILAHPFLADTPAGAELEE